MRKYRRSDWKNYRQEVIELDGGVCVRCKRGPLDGAVLQVHHKQYLPGKLPWEYPYRLCETLCSGCHASEHGIIRPFTGWECVGFDDLGSLSGECELCGNPLRYIFVVQHEKWPSLEVGETCCDHLTETSEASDHLDSLRRYEARKQRFIASPRWKRGEGGTWRLKQNGMYLEVVRIEHEYMLCVDRTQGKRRFPSANATKGFAFEVLENGELEAFKRKKQRRV